MTFTIDDIIDHFKSKRKKSIAERFFGMGSMTTTPTKKYYNDAGGSMVMSFDPSLAGKKGEMYEVSIVASSKSGRNRDREMIYFYAIKLKHGGNALTMKITGTDLFQRVYQAVQLGGFFQSNNPIKN